MMMALRELPPSMPVVWEGCPARELTMVTPGGAAAAGAGGVGALQGGTLMMMKVVEFL